MDDLYQEQEDREDNRADDLEEALEDEEDEEFEDDEDDDGRYFGSVLFFKHLILLTLILVIGSLLALTIHFGRAYHRAISVEDKAVPSSAVVEDAETEDELPEEQEKPEGELTAAEILSESPVIIHALGEVDGNEGLNCLEGFLRHYEAGARVFEVDIRVTSDGHAVLRHDWRSGWQEGVSERSIPTLEEFRRLPILGTYTPLSFRDLLLLMQEYPDVCIVTDTKFTEPEAVTAQFQAMLDDARALGLSYLFDRIVVQVYTRTMYGIVDNIHHFPNYIYTLYLDHFDRTEDAFRERCIFCKEHGIMGLTLWASWWDEPVYRPISQWHGVKVYTHTVNDAEEARSQLDAGVSAVYTDYLLPGDVAAG